MVGKSSLYNNKILYNYFVVFSDAVMVWSIIIPFMKLKGLSFFNIMVFFSMMELLTLLLEIPSGFLSDYFGHKLIVITGSLLKIISFILIMFCDYFIILVVDCIIFALSDALLSGSTSAILYDSLIEKNEEKEYGQILRKAKSNSLYFSAILILSSGYLYNKNIYLPFLLTSIFITISFIISLFFEKTNKKQHINLKKIIKSYKFHIEIADCVKSIKKFLLVMALMISFQSIFTNMNFFTQEIMINLQIDYNYYGLIFFISNIISAYIWKKGNVIQKKFGENTLIIISIYFCICIFGVIQFNAYKGSVLILPFMRVVSATLIPLFDIELNELIKSDRATILSFVNAVNGLFKFTIDLFIGKITDIYGIYYLLKIIILIIFTFIIFIVLIKSFISTNKNSKI